jgi:xanthine/uracil permease
MSQRRARVSRSQRNGVAQRHHKPRPRTRVKLSRAAWLAPIFGATIIVTLAWAASLEQATPEIIVAASLLFSLLEGVVFAFVAAIWSPRGVPIAVGMSVLTALLATPGRWELARLHTGQVPQTLDLAADMAANLAWASFAGLAGATILRERLTKLLPNR